MSDDPISLLNLQEETAPEVGRDGGWWIASILSLVGFAGLGFLIAFSLPHQESDWIGARFIVAIGGGILLGALFSVAFATVSLARNEKRSAWSMLAALPSLVFLLGCLTSLLQEGMNRYQAKAAVAARAEAIASIRADPEIVLREHWDRSNNDFQYAAFRNSFSDPQVRYTASMLQRIYNDAPVMRDYIFVHPACSRDFLVAHFQEAYDRCPKISYVMLASIVANPNTPLELVEQVAQARQLPVGAVEPAKRALKARAPH